MFQTELNIEVLLTLSLVTPMLLQTTYEFMSLDIRKPIPNEEKTYNHWKLV